MNDLPYYECMKVVVKILGVHYQVGTNKEKTINGLFIVLFNYYYRKTTKSNYAEITDLLIL
jgi:hypothetical protein